MSITKILPPSVRFKTFLRAGIAACTLVAALQCVVEVVGLSVLYHGYIFRPQDLYKSQIFLLIRRILNLGRHSSMPFALDSYLGPDVFDKSPVFFTIIGVYAAVGLATGICLGIISWLVQRKKSVASADIYRMNFCFALACWVPLNVIIYLFKVLEYRYKSQRAIIFLFAGAAALCSIWLLYRFCSSLVRKWNLTHKVNLDRFALYTLALALFLATSSLGSSIWNFRGHDHLVTAQGKSFSTPVSSQTPKTNVILISIDSLRPDHLSCYNYKRKTSPNIDDLAKDGILFKNAFSSTTWTYSAHRSLLTSTFPEATDRFSYMDPLSSKLVTLAEVFAQHNYTTAGFVSTDFLNSNYGFNQGFQMYDDFTVHYDKPRDLHVNVTTPVLHQAVENWLKQNTDKAFFLFLHYWDVHYDYNAPAPFHKMFDPDYKGTMTATNFIKNTKINKDMNPEDLAHILALYDGEIAFTDHFIGQLLRRLKELNIYDNSMIVLTADHGDEFFEHGKKGHMRTLYDEVLRIPLIIKFPVSSSLKADRKVDQIVSIMDIMPTILGFLGMNIPGQAQGRNLFPLLHGMWDSKNDFIYASLRNEMFALRSADQKFVQRSNLPTKEIYDLVADPGERTNLIGKPGRKKAEADQLLILLDYLNVQRKQLRSLSLIRQEESGEMDDALKEQMKALGYIQ